MSALGLDRHPRVSSAHPESIHELLTRLVTDVFRLLDDELALATAEMKQHLGALVRATIVLFAGVLSAMIGLLLLATGAALEIGRIIGSIVGGYAIVGVAIVLIGVVVVSLARSRLAMQSLFPLQTIDQIRKDVTWKTRD